MLCEKCGKNPANIHIQNVSNGQMTETHLCGRCAAELGLLKNHGNSFTAPALGSLFGDLGSFFSGDFDSLFSGIGGFLPGGDAADSGSGAFTSFFGSQARPAPAVSVPNACPLCGATPNDIASTGRAGCPQCYATFRQLFAPIIRRIHGSATHTGSIPSSAGEVLKRQRRMETLKAELQTAVAAQEYEKAAKLRDEIRGLEKDEGKQA